MKKVYKALNIQDAHIVKDVLQGHGLHAKITGESLAAAMGELPFYETGPVVWVEDLDYLKARKIVDEIELGPQEGPDWTCTKCQEVSESHFTECWKCGTSQN